MEELIVTQWVSSMMQDLQYSELRWVVCLKNFNQGAIKS